VPDGEMPFAVAVAVRVNCDSSTDTVLEEPIGV
jgi:hypothetical protein